VNQLFVYYYHNMENKYRKYLNSSCNPDEFSDVIADLSALDTKGKGSDDVLLKLWNEILNSLVVEIENSKLLNSIQHRILLEESKTLLRHFNLYRNLLKIAAVLIFVFLSTTILFYTNIKEQVSSDLTETVTTPFGARTNFKLPDGSEVWLNSGTKITFPKHYGKIRNVELTGEAYFKVVKDGKPFIVKTDYGKIQVMGTSFDVKSYKDENFETTLVEGSVKVSNNLNQVSILKPGQQSIINEENEMLKSDVNTDLYTSWKKGKLIFVKEPFKNVAKALERWYNVKIVIQGDKLKNLGYTGIIEMETFSEIMELINTTEKIKYNYDKNARILKISGR